ncbi:MAG: hypothetical protein AB7U82_10675 [Blastocatellales bacterium]
MKAFTPNNLKDQQQMMNRYGLIRSALSDSGGGEEISSDQFTGCFSI